MSASSHTNNIVFSNNTISYTFGAGLDINHGFLIAYVPGVPIDVIGGGAPVPEPVTMLLFGTGLIGLAGIARKHSKQK